MGSGPKVLMLYFSRIPFLSRTETANQYSKKILSAMLVPFKGILRVIELNKL
jgi:hypothetical protein